MKYRTPLVCLAFLYPFFVDLNYAIRSWSILKNPDFLIYAVKLPSVQFDFFVFILIAFGLSKSIKVFWWSALTASIWQLYTQTPVCYLVVFSMLTQDRFTFTTGELLVQLVTISWLITFIVLLLISRDTSKEEA